METEKIVANLDDTVYDDEDIDPMHEKEVKSSSNSYNNSFKVVQTLKTQQHNMIVSIGPSTLFLVFSL